MLYFPDGAGNPKPVTTTELKKVFDNLDSGDPDGGTYEDLIVEDIDENGNIYFGIRVGSTY